MIEILKKYDPKLAGKEYLAVFGATSMMYLVEGLKNAGRNLTTETMIKGMEMIKNWKPEGIGGSGNLLSGPPPRGQRFPGDESGKGKACPDNGLY